MDLKFQKSIIYDQHYAYFDNNNNILSEEQYGFRTKHSTELAAVLLLLVCLITLISQIVE